MLWGGAAVGEVHSRWDGQVANHVSRKLPQTHAMKGILALLVALTIEYRLFGAGLCYPFGAAVAPGGPFTAPGRVARGAASLRPSWRGRGLHGVGQRSSESWSLG